MSVFADMIEDAVVRHKANIALIDTHANKSFSFTDMNSYFDKISHQVMASGLKAGDHAAIYQRNSYHWVAAEGGLAKQGIVIVPINIYLSGTEAAWVLDHSVSAAVFLDDETAALLDGSADKAIKPILRFNSESLSGISDEADGDVVDFKTNLSINAASPYKIMYSSATTGVPKGIICPNGIMAGVVTGALANQLRDVESKDRLLIATPLTHVANSFFWAFFMRGASTVLMRRFDADEYCKQIIDNAVTHSFLVPTLLIDLINFLEENPGVVASLRSSSLRALWYAGSPIPPATAKRAESLLGPILNQQYGLTELYSGFPAMACTELRSAWHSKKPGSCGRSVTGCVIRIEGDNGNLARPGEPGEVIIRLQGAPAGYWSPPQSLHGAFRDGWIHTGDIGYLDEDEFLYVIDRKNDMIISGGLNIYPAEVEACIAEHPDVVQSAVVGVSDDRWVEVPIAAVVRRSDGTVSEEELIDFVRSKIAHYKCPKRIEFVEKLAVTSAGKVSRQKVRAELLGEA